MSSSSSIRDLFFQECEDLIGSLSDDLHEMADGQHDDETINAVFRAVHSIKGSGGAFQLTDLVNFAHQFETVLDMVRSRRLTLDDEVIRVIQRAGDILADLVDAARTGNPHNEEAVGSSFQALQKFIGPKTDPEQETEFVFEAVQIDLDVPQKSNKQLGYIIHFRPSKEFYDQGHEPLFLISALEKLGVVIVTANLSELPDSMDESDWEQSYITWNIQLETDAAESRVSEIFEIFDFAEGLFSHEITPLLTEEEVLNPSFEAHSEGAGTLSPECTEKPEGATVIANAEECEMAPLPLEKPSKKPRPTLRVDLDRVDRLINAVGELIINQAVIAQKIEDAEIPPAAEISIDLEDYRHLAREIQEGVMAIRAQPVKPLFQRMSRIIREVTEATDKQVDLITDGEGTEVDKTVVEQLADPLTHMIRNAIDHGIEPPDVRRAKGKSETGTIHISAQHRSGSVLIEIADDGAGLDRARIREIAVKRGIVPSDSELSITDIDNLLFAPGFSTASEVTNLSGRGVGMDVVKTAITNLGGRISISSEQGKGTTFSISLPLTLAVMDGMIITVGEQTMVVPITSVLETIRPTSNDLSRIGVHGQLLSIRGQFVPVIDLAESLNQGQGNNDLTEKVLLLVRTDRMTQCALAVDSISDQRQVVIKSLKGNYGDIQGVSAATILGDGKIALILDPNAIAEVAASHHHIPADVTLEKEMTHV